MNNQRFFDIEIVGKDIIEGNLSDTHFEKVTFRQCDWQEIKVENCGFVDCVFEKCNLSLMEAKTTNFVNLKFIDSKIVGVNWAKIKSLLGISLSFERCILDYSSFAEVNFVKSKIKECSVKNVDFSKSNLTECDCRGSDFDGAGFGVAKLIKTDFREAKNYTIDILESPRSLKGAKFSHFEVENLLSTLNIVIE